MTHSRFVCLSGVSVRREAWVAIHQLRKTPIRVALVPLQGGWRPARLEGLLHVSYRIERKGCWLPAALQ